MAHDPSPRKNVLGQNYTASTHLLESRQGLKNILEGKVSHDHDSVFARLGVSEINDKNAEDCARELLNALKPQVTKLQKLEEQATAIVNIAGVDGGADNTAL